MIERFIHTAGSLLLATFALCLIAALLILALQAILLLPALLFPDNDVVRIAVEWLYEPFL